MPNGPVTRSDAQLFADEVSATWQAVIRPYLCESVTGRENTEAFRLAHCNPESQQGPGYQGSLIDQ